VQEAIVERRLPHTVFVQITERRPFAVWQNRGKFVLVDRKGDVVTDTEIGPIAKDLPLIVGAGAPQAAAPLLDAIAGLPSLQQHLVAAVRVGDRRWNLRMNNGADILLPEGAEMAALTKLAELQAQHALLDRPLQTMDLRLPDKLVIRPRADSAPQDKPTPTPSTPARKPT
jgi:cell division protein FtsQ